MKRLFQNILIVAALCGLFSQSQFSFAQMPGTFQPLTAVAAGGGVLDCVGGTITYAGGNTIHTFTTVGSSDFLCPTARTANYLVVGGGGGAGGGVVAAGGGAGGMLTGTTTIPVGTSTVVIGGGGAPGAASARGINGSDSILRVPTGGTTTLTALIPTQAPTVAGSGYTNYEFRTRFNAPLYLAGAPATGTAIRITIGGGAAGANLINGMWCGHAGAASPSLNFDGNQVPITFSGSTTATVPAAASPLASDIIPFSFDKTKDIVCSVNWGSNALVWLGGTANSNIFGNNSPGTGSNAGNTTAAISGNANYLYGAIFSIEEGTYAFTTVATAKGGGGGGNYSALTGLNGGSGGGGGMGSAAAGTGVAGQGNAGAAASAQGSGGGGGAGGTPALPVVGSPNRGGDGGVGLASSITGASVFYAGGGGGAPNNVAGNLGGAAGNGGGGQGGTTVAACTNGVNGTGGGGGGISNFGSACKGGDGVVIVSYRSGVPNPNCVGGTITTVGANTVHTFINTGTANLNCGIARSANYLIVAGGGGGASGGGGAGAVRIGATIASAGDNTIVVATGGAGVVPTGTGTKGANSSALGITAGGGGGGGLVNGLGGNSDAAGGSGGGGGATSASVWAGGTGGIGGNNGGTQSYITSPYPSSGGGGCGAVGGSGIAGPKSGVGGVGCASSITGVSITYGGGGGGACYNAASTGCSNVGGAGGGGTGNDNANGSAGTANTGGGGGASPSGFTGGNGGSGIVVVSYATGSPAPIDCLGGTITTSGANTVHTFTTSGTIACGTGKSINYLVVAGGGFGGVHAGSATYAPAGGGAGGLRQGTGAFLAAGPTAIIVGAGSPAPPTPYTVTQCTTRGTGGNSSIFGIASAVGGGNGGCAGSQPGSNGGSGGGGNATQVKGTGTAGQGNDGGAPGSGPGGYGAGSGGGCGSAGLTPTATTGANGGAGCTSSITGTSVCYAGGGGSGITGASGTTGTATCGGGNAGAAPGPSVGVDGAANTGGGGGGPSSNSTAVAGSAGGSGIVVVSYATGSTQAPPPGNWYSLIATQSPPSLGSGWTNYQLRARHTTAAYLGPVPATGSKIRVTVTGGGATTNSLGQVWCGHASAANPSLDFDGNQVQLTFSGNPNITLPSTGTVLSDAVNFAFDKTKDLVCSFWDTGSTVVYGSNAASAGINMAGQAGTGSSAGTTVAGFTVANSNYAVYFTLIEIFG